MCNGVNLEKERGLFEQWFVTKYPYTSLDRDNGVVGTYWHERVEMSWQSWLSSISREGYKYQQAKIDELQARIDEITNHVGINFDEERDDDQHSYWSGYNQAMRELNYILKGGGSE